MFAALGIVNGDISQGEVEIFDAQAQTLHESQTAAVEDLGDEFPGIGEMSDDAVDFFPGEDGRRPALTPFGCKFSRW